MRSIYLQSFMLIPHIVLELCPWKSSKCKNKQRAIIKKLGKTALRFLCIAHLLNEIDLPTSFMLIPFVVSKLCPGQEKRTDRRMDILINGTNVTFPLIVLAIFSHERLKKRHTSKNGINRIKENLLLPIVLQVTRVSLGLYGKTSGWNGIRGHFFCYFLLFNKGPVAPSSIVTEWTLLFFFVLFTVRWRPIPIW
jgi:hypothetical protein